VVELHPKVVEAPLLGGEAARRWPAGRNERDCASN